MYIKKSKEFLSKSNNKYTFKRLGNTKTTNYAANISHFSLKIIKCASAYFQSNRG